MQHTKEQIKAVEIALANNPVFDNIASWVEDGQITKHDLNLLAVHILNAIPTEDKQ